MAHHRLLGGAGQQRRQLLRRRARCWLHIGLAEYGGEGVHERDRRGRAGQGDQGSTKACATRMEGVVCRANELVQVAVQITTAALGGTNVLRPPQSRAATLLRCKTNASSLLRHVARHERHAQHVLTATVLNVL